MDEPRNTILAGDCIAGMNALSAGSVDLVFADPPFNIGYDYDVYHDKVGYEHYLAWSHDWIGAVHRILKSDGAFWLAIGDEYAAELKLESQRLGFHCRSWVIWYYTFGVNCSRKFTRSHAHLFHFVKDPQRFTFRENEPENRIPSARQLVYNDKRANPKGRLPDDTWIIRPGDMIGELAADEETWSPGELSPPIDDDRTWTLRPQDLAQCFKGSEDTWYFPRVAGTFKERAGFHGCQMPEQLLARIIRACTRDDEVVLDPFSGSATTAAVAKKLGRSYLAFDLSAEYVEQGRARLRSIRVGDPLDGSSEPLVSAPKTNGRVQLSPRGAAKSLHTERGKSDRSAGKISARTENGIMEAFSRTYEGYSADRLVADEHLNSAFRNCCYQLGIVGDPRIWNSLLFRLRKGGKLVGFPTTKRTSIAWEECDCYLFASEIAWQMMLEEHQVESLDEILCDPELARQFDAIAGRFGPGYSSLEYRWAALKLRKKAKTARSRAAGLPRPRLGRVTRVDQLDWDAVHRGPGIYLLASDPTDRVYAGETLNLRRRLEIQFKESSKQEWAGATLIQTLATATDAGDMLTLQSWLVRRYKPRLNLQDLGVGR